MWIFSRFADGVEAVAGDALTGRGSGSTVRRRAATAAYVAASPTLHLGQHAFTAVATRQPSRDAAAVAERDGAAKPTMNGDDATAQAAAGGSASGSASFHVTTPDPSSPVLVGVAGDEIDLGTPLSWEEDHCFVVECSLRGAYLWSDRGQAWGQKLADKCFFEVSAAAAEAGDQQGAATTKLYEAHVDVSWTPEVVKFSMANPAATAGGGDAPPSFQASLSRPRVADIQGRTIECDAPPNLAPCATFFCEESRVTVL